MAERAIHDMRGLELSLFVADDGQKRRALNVAACLCESLSPVPPLPILVDLVVSMSDRHMWRPTSQNSSIRQALQRYERVFLRPVLSDRGWRAARTILATWSSEESDRGLAFLIGRSRSRSQADIDEPLVSPRVFRNARSRSIATGDDVERIAGSLAEHAKLMLPTDEDLALLRARIPLLPIRRQILVERMVKQVALLKSTAQRSTATRRSQRGSLPRPTSDLGPGGGYHSLVTSSRAESLVPSQWAYAEDRRPDLLDALMVGGNMLCYSRRLSTSSAASQRLRLRFHPSLFPGPMCPGWNSATALAAAIVKSIGAASPNNSMHVDVVVPSTGGAANSDWLALREVIRAEIASRVAIWMDSQSHAPVRHGCQVLFADEPLPLTSVKSAKTLGVLPQGETLALYRLGKPYRQIRWDQSLPTFLDWIQSGGRS